MSSRHLIHTGDVLDVLRTIPDSSIDATLSDVPYGLGTHQPTLAELVAYLQGDDLDLGGDFMGRDWQVPSVRVWREIFRVLKPGAPLLIFGGSRTVDLIAVGMRAAGFEIRDTILGWIQSQGMPKPATTTDKYIDARLGAAREVVGTRVLTGNAAVSTKQKGGTLGIQVGTAPPKVVDVTAPGSEEGKRWDGYGHALRPSHEPVIVARKPLDGSIAENVLAHDVGGLNVKGCRLTGAANEPGKWFQTGSKASANVALAGPNMARAPKEDVPGRWPPNVFYVHSPGCTRAGTRKVKAAPAWNDNRPTPAAFTGNATSTVHHADDDGTETVEAWECAEGCPVRELDDQSGERSTHGGRVTPDMAGMGFAGGNGSAREIPPSSGGASRCFPCFAWGPEDGWPFIYESKVDAAEREAGCEHLAPSTEGGAHNDGPCLKPVAVTTWLARLELPPARVGATRTVLIPYCGTCSEVIGALRAGWDQVIGIERDAHFVEIGEARIARWAEVPAHVEPSEVKTAKSNTAQLDIFAGAR